MAPSPRPMRHGFLVAALTMPAAQRTSISMNKIEKSRKIRKICVYCGFGPGIDPAFVESARAFGAILAKNGVGLVLGGGSVGMMGAIAVGARSDRHHPSFSSRESMRCEALTI